MLRIRGRIGDWPVDLTVEMDEEDWQRLGAQLHVAPAASPEPVAPPAAAPSRQADPRWEAALGLLRAAGRLEGPRLLADLEALAGSAAAGKRLLVRLRHCEQVQLEAGADAPVYVWKG